MQRKSMAIVLAAVFVALTIVFGALPFVFLVPVLLASVTTDFKTSFLVSAFFGVVSLLYSFMGSSPVAVAFVSQPWIPIVARLFIGPATRGAYLLISKCIKREGRMKIALPAGVAAAVGSIVNTALVVTLLVLCMPSLEVQGVTMLLYVPTMLISGAIELAVTAAVLPPLALAMDKVRRRAMPQRAEKVEEKGE